MQVDKAIMALTLLNAELMVQRDEARAERDDARAQLEVVRADAAAAKPKRTRS